MDEGADFLSTFFTLCPQANEKELEYYVKDNAIKPIQKNSTFVELVNPAFIKKDNTLEASVYVKYINTVNKPMEYFQYEHIVEKVENWKIVK